MAGKFDKILADGFAKNKFGANTLASSNWLRKKAQALSGSVAPRHILGDNRRKSGSISPGSMFFMQYDPKTKAKLPYYDRYPLFIMVDFAPKGFYGLNLHYIPYRERANLMNALYMFMINTNFDEHTKIKLSYSLLRNVSSARAFRPCFKRYLFSHIVQGPAFIHPIEWNLLLFLPVERFVKASKQKVYADSRAIMEGI